MLNEDEIVVAGSQSTALDVLWVSVLIPVKSLEVKLSVILHVIVEPSATTTCEAVFELLAETERFEVWVVYEPLSILYSTL